MIREPWVLFVSDKTRCACILSKQLKTPTHINQLIHLYSSINRFAYKTVDRICIESDHLFWHGVAFDRTYFERILIE